MWYFTFYYRHRFNLLFLSALLCLVGILKRWVGVVFALASLKLTVGLSFVGPFLSWGPPPVQFVVIDWGDWMAHVIASAVVEITRRRLSSFWNSLRRLPVLPFNFGGRFHRGSNGLCQFYVVRDLFLFRCYLHFSQSVDPLRLVSTDLESFTSTTWLPYSPVFAQVCSVSGKPCTCTAQIHSLRWPLQHNSLSTPLSGVVYDTVYDHCGGGEFSTIFLFAKIFCCLSVHPYQVRMFLLHKSKINFWRPRKKFGTLLI